MSKFDCSIKFYKPVDRDFLPGDKVHGKVIITNREPIQARFLKIGWKGESKTKFDGDSESNFHSYLNDYIVPWVAKNDQTEFPAGTHAYRFNFTLPKDCPPTYSDLFGSINYSVKVELNRPWRFDLEKTGEFVVGHRNCLAITSADMFNRAKFRNHSTTGTFFVDGMVALEVHAPKRAYSPGEEMKVLVKIDNNSPRAITNVETELIRQTHYHRRPHQEACSHANGIQKCVMEKKNRKNSERPVMQGAKSIRIEPYSKACIETSVRLKEDLIPTFSSSMISAGYLLSVTISNSKFIKDQVRANVRIVIGETATKGITSSSKTEETPSKQFCTSCLASPSPKFFKAPPPPPYTP